MLGIPKNKVLLVDHDEKWAEEFDSVKSKLSSVLNGNIVDIQHVGSTSIKGIMAKPMLDVSVLVKTITPVFETMKENGYEYIGEVVTGKFLFILWNKEECSLQHIHCHEETNSEWFYRQIQFRDYLRSNPQYAQEYEQLKQELYELYPNDRESYTRGKQAFFDKINQLVNEPEAE